MVEIHDVLNLHIGEGLDDFVEFGVIDFDMLFDGVLCFFVGPVQGLGDIGAERSFGGFGEK